MAPDNATTSNNKLTDPPASISPQPSITLTPNGHASPPSHHHPPPPTKPKRTGVPEKRRHESSSSTDSTESYANYIPTPPDGGWGWVIVVASLLCNMIVDGLGYSFGVFLLEFTDYFQESKSKVSLVGSLLCGVYLFAGPVVSALTNKFGCRPVTVAGGVIAGFSFFLSTMAPSVDVLIISYGIMGGFGLGMMYLPSIVSVGYYFEKKRALATGIAVCGSGIGTFIFAPLAEYLMEVYDWKNALLIIAGIALNGSVFGMLMRPLEPTKKQRRPRAKNLLDRIKEQAKGNRDRTFSDNSTSTYSVRDTNAVLERVMQAKLQRENLLQEDDSELGSLPSIFFVRQQSRKDSARDSRIHKLSLSDRGDVTSYLGSPVGSLPRIVVEQGEGGGGRGREGGGEGGGEGGREVDNALSHPQTTSVPIKTEDSSKEGNAQKENNSSFPGSQSNNGQTGSESQTGNETRLPQSENVKTGSESQTGSPAGLPGSESKSGSVAGLTGSESKTGSVTGLHGSEGERGEDLTGNDAKLPLRNEKSGDAGTVYESQMTIFNDAESWTIPESTTTERSEYFTPPTSPPDTSSPTTPEKERNEDNDDNEFVEHRADVVLDSTKNGFIQRKSDPEVTKLMAHPAKRFRNGSVPSNIHHHVHEVAPLLEVPQSKTTLVTLAMSDKNVFRLKHPHDKLLPNSSLHSLNVSKKDLARPLYRKDIFYSGSVLNIPQFQSQPDMKSYITSITTIPGELAIAAGGESKVWSYLCFPQSCKDTLKEMLDFSLLRDPGFFLICLGSVFTFLGFYVPFVYAIDLAHSMGIGKQQGAFIISIIGIANTIGRVVIGWLADLRRIDSLVITYVSIFICGIATAVFPLCNSYATLCVTACFFGLSVAAFISLSSILICDLLGLEKLTNGFGLMTMFRGMAAMSGPPLAGIVYEYTNMYDASFYLGGGLLIIGGFCHLALQLPCIKERQREIFVETITVEEIPEEPRGSGVKPELVTMEEVMTSV